MLLTVQNGQSCNSWGGGGGMVLYLNFQTRKVAHCAEFTCQAQSVLPETRRQILQKEENVFL